MPVSSRDLWLVLKAQDQTQRALNSFSRNVRNAGDTVRMAQLQSQRAAALGAIAQSRMTNELQRNQIANMRAAQSVLQHNNAVRQNAVAVARAEAAQLSAQKTVKAGELATLRATKASASAITTKQSEIATIAQEINIRRAAIAAIQGDIAAEQGNINSIQRHINARQGQINAGNSYITNQKRVIAGIDDEIKKTEAQTRAAQEHEKHLDRISKNMQQVSQTAIAMGFAMTAAGIGMIIGLGSAIKTAMEYERQVRLTATQVSNFSGNLNELADIGRRTARDIAVPFQDVQTTLYDIFSSIDVSVQDSEKFLRTFAKAAVAGQTELQAVSRGTIGIMNAFHLTTGDLNRILDIQFKLVQKGIGTYDEWADRFGKVSPSAMRAGQSIEMMAAALASATRFGIPAAQAATSVARVFDAFSNPKAAIGLKKLGVSVVDAKGNFREFNVVMDEFRTALAKVPGGESGKIAAILDVFKGAGSTIEMRKFLQTLLLSSGGMEQFNAILGEVSNSAGSMDQAYGLMSNSVASKTQILKNQWSLLKESLGKALMPTFAKVVDWLSKLLDKFNKLDDKTKRIIAVVTGLSAIFLTVGGVLLLVVGGLTAIAAAFVVAGPAIAIVAGALLALVGGLGGIAAAFLAAYKNSENFRMIVDNIKTDLEELHTIGVDFAKKFKAAFDENVMPPLRDLKKYIDDNVMPAFRTFRDELGDKIVKAVKDVADALEKQIKPAMESLGKTIDEKIKPAVKGLTEMWIAHRDEIMQVLGMIIQLVKWMAILGGYVAFVMGTQLGQIALKGIFLFIGGLALLISIVGNTIAMINGIAKAILGAIAAFINLRAAIVNFILKALGDIGSIPGRIQNAFGNMGDLLFQAGMDIISGLMSGISRKAFGGALGGLLGAVTSFVISHKGPPAKDLQVLVPAGRNLMGGLMKGINDQLPALLDQINGVNSAFSFVGTSAASGGLRDSNFHRPELRSSGDNAPVVKNYYITQNITTQEISPIRQAAALGWEVTTVM